MCACVLESKRVGKRSWEGVEREKKDKETKLKRIKNILKCEKASTMFTVTNIPEKNAHISVIWTIFIKKLGLQQF